MRKTIISILTGILPLFIALAGCGPATAPEPKTKPSKPPAVRLVQTENGRLPRTVTVTGTLAADEEVLTAFKVAGEGQRDCG